jgi:hypothetical protein
VPALSLVGELAVELAVSSFVDASHPGAWVSWAEGDEHEDDFSCRVASELKDEAKGSL